MIRAAVLGLARDITVAAFTAASPGVENVALTGLYATMVVIIRVIACHGGRAETLPGEPLGEYVNAF